MYSSIISSLNDLNISNTSSQESLKTIEKERPQFKLFEVSDFVQMIDTASSAKKKRIYNNQEHVGAYDISTNCVRHVVLKLLNYPLSSYHDSWLPIGFRGALGSAVHNYIQENYTGFTELEASIKVPSIKTSVRLDAMINDNVLVEIKSCPFADYSKIIKTRTPRDADFYQTIFYRWLLHNHLSEAKTQTKLRTQPPSLQKYNINKIQFVYVAHDLISADVENMASSRRLIANMKKLLKSRYNQFYFITTLTLDLDAIDVSIYESYVVQKLNVILECLQSNSIPPLDNKFIDKSNCFFCPYYNVCNTI